MEPLDLQTISREFIPEVTPDGAEVISAPGREVRDGGEDRERRLSEVLRLLCL